MNTDIENKKEKQLETYDEYKYKFDNPNNIYDDTMLNPLLIHAVQNNASDVFIKTVDYVRCDLYGKKYKLSLKKLDSNEIMSIIRKIYGDNSGLSKLTGGGTINTTYVIKNPSKGIYFRFRVNIISVSVNDTTGYEITMRHIPNVPPKLDKSDIPKEVIEAFNLSNGLVLVVGATGSGKSTLISSIIRDKLENPEISKRIVSYEAPIEFVFNNVPQKYSFITQTEVPRMIKTFKEGVEEALRRKPDDIFIGEMRDTETITNGVLASQFGHLVYSTMHVNSVAETIKRVANIFTGDERTSAVYDILTSVRLIISQRLRPTLDGKRIAIREYIYITDEIRNHLISQNMNEISFHLEQAVWDYGVPFAVHAKQRLLENKISHEIYNQFTAGLNKTDKQIDEIIKKLKKEGNVMFQENDF